MSNKPKPLFVSFNRTWHSYAGMAFGIALLNLLTLGLYKPYGITRVRRALYNNIYVGGDALEYTGNAVSLSAVTFYPSLAFLFLLVVPGILQFMVSLSTALAIGGVQAVLVWMFFHYRSFLERQYELSQIGWRGQSFTLMGSAFASMWRGMGFSLANLATLGLTSLWRRLWLARRDFNGLYYGRSVMRCAVAARPLVPLFLGGWLVSLVGAYALWLWLQADAVLVWQQTLGPMLGGDTAAPVASAAAGTSGDFYGGMLNIPGMDMSGTDPMAMSDPMAMGQIKLIGSMFNLLFGVQLWLNWRLLCMAPYEAAWWRELAASLTLENYTLRFEGNMVVLFVITVVSFNLNFILCNLTRPFTSYMRTRFFCRNVLVREKTA